MKEAALLEKEFSWRKGWNLKKVGFLVTDLLMYLQTLDKKKLRQFACTVDLEAHNKLKAEGYRLDDPIAICNRYCAECVLYWYANDFPGLIHSAHFFFDQGEPFREPFETEWAEMRKRRIYISTQPILWTLIKSVTPADMRDKPPLQATDMLAWASNRDFSVGKDRPFKYLLEIMKKIIPSSWIIWDEIS
jgi:hypothetical protein